MKCFLKSCGGFAEFKPRVRVWATPERDHGPCEMLPDFGLCRPCTENPQTATDILCLGFQKVVEEQLEARGMMPPLWGTAKVDYLPIPTATA